MSRSLRLFVLAAIVSASPAAAQLCDWGGTPSLPVPDVEHLGARMDNLRAPARLAVDSLDRIWITDPTRGVVVVKDAHGSPVGVHGGLGTPLAVAVDAFDTVYLSDQDTGRVGIFDPSWQLVGVLGVGPGEFIAVTDIAVDPDLGTGQVFVADGGANLIKVYGPDHQLVRSFGGNGAGPGEFDFPSAIWVSSFGEVYVGDQNNDRVQVFDRSGVFQRCFGAQGGLNRNFGRIQGLTGDSTGRLFVVDAFQGRVQVFDADGASLSVVGGLGDGPGRFRTPHDVAIDGYGRLYISAVNSGRIEVFGLDDFGSPPPSAWVFGDGFESGDTHGWSDASP